MDKETSGNVGFVVLRLIYSVLGLGIIIGAMILGGSTLETGEKSGIMLGMCVAGLWLMAIAALKFYRTKPIIRNLTIAGLPIISIFAVHIIVSGWDYQFVPVP